MRIQNWLWPALAGTMITSTNAHIAKIYIQPVQAVPTTPVLLADVEYSVRPPFTMEVISYEAPDLEDDVSLVRIGVYEPESQSWTSSTSVVSVDNFTKGYSAHIMLSLDAMGNIVGTSLRGVQIDAGKTRSFGPQGILLPVQNGKQPALNKPVVLSREGKKLVEEEKTFFQKYAFSFGHSEFQLRNLLT